MTKLYYAFILYTIMFELITPKEAAKILGVDRVTVYRWIKIGLLDAYKIGGIVRIKKDDLKNIIEGKKK